MAMTGWISSSGSCNWAQGAFGGYATRITSSQGKNLSPSTLRTQSPASVTRSRGRAVVMIAAASTTPMPIRPTWSKVRKVTPSLTSLSSSPAITDTPTTTTDATAARMVILRGRTW
jgi:hypothetical protein